MVVEALAVMVAMMLVVMMSAVTVAAVALASSPWGGWEEVHWPLQSQKDGELWCGGRVSKRSAPENEQRPGVTGISSDGGGGGGDGAVWPERASVRTCQMGKKTEGQQRHERRKRTGARGGGAEGGKGVHARDLQQAATGYVPTSACYVATPRRRLFELDPQTPAHRTPSSDSGRQERRRASWPRRRDVSAGARHGSEAKRLRVHATRASKVRRGSRKRPWRRRQA
eukprot:6186681-Pleurochrysis_carterae.AAC.2